MKNTHILIGLIIVAIAIVIVFLLINQNGNGNMPNSSNSEQPNQSTIITLPIGARGDFVDPGPIENECQGRMEKYIKSSEFDSKGFSKCTLIESKVGYSEEECPNGFSPQGCSICKLTCE